MDKLQMAMRFAEIMLIEHFKGNGIYNSYGYKDGICEDAWIMADAMQAEADKRKPSGLPEALREEWQPDWSQAPEWAKWWAIAKCGQAWWSNKLMFVRADGWGNSEFGFQSDKAPSFNYQGNWQESLRKRPQ